MITRRETFRIAGTCLVSMGASLLMFSGVTMVWGDPITGLRNASEQAELREAFERMGPPPPQDPGQGLTAAQTLRAQRLLTRDAARKFRAGLSDGRAVGRISIPDIGKTLYMVSGTDAAQLDKGPGVYKYGGLPGMGRPVGVAGHRTTHGAPFMDLNLLRRGSPITLTTPYGRFSYEVRSVRIIANDDWSILTPGAATGRKCMGWCEHLVLTACHPKYSAAKRIAVFATPRRPLAA